MKTIYEHWEHFETNFLDDCSDAAQRLAAKVCFMAGAHIMAEVTLVNGYSQNELAEVFNKLLDDLQEIIRE